MCVIVLTKAAMSLPAARYFVFYCISVSPCGTKPIYRELKCVVALYQASSIIHYSSLVGHPRQETLDRIGADLAAWPAEVDIAAMLGPRQAQQHRLCPGLRQARSQHLALDRRDERIAPAVDEQRPRAVWAGVAGRRRGGGSNPHAGPGSTPAA